MNFNISKTSNTGSKKKIWKQILCLFGVLMLMDGIYFFLALDNNEILLNSLKSDAALTTSAFFISACYFCLFITTIAVLYFWTASAIPHRIIRQILVFFAYPLLLSPIINLGFYIYSRHLLNHNLLQDAFKYILISPLTHKLILIGLLLLYSTFILLYYRHRLFGDSFNNHHERKFIRYLNFGSLLLCSILFLSVSFFINYFPQFKPFVSTKNHLITAYLPSFNLCYLNDKNNNQVSVRQKRFIPKPSKLQDISIISDYLKELPQNSPKRKPNVIFIMLESVMNSHMGIFGYHRNTTPNFDKLAKNSLLFENAYSPANESKHAQTSILSSTWPMRGRNNNFIPVDLTYPRVMPWEIFKKIGYRTALISTQNEHWLGMSNFQLTGNTPPDIYLHGPNINEGPSYTGNLRKKDAETVNKRLFQFMEESMTAKKPFLLITNYQRTHFPYFLPSTYDPKFKPVMHAKKYRHWRSDDFPEGINSFDSALYYVDFHLGKLIDKIDALGIAENTIVAIVSDHGSVFIPESEPVSTHLYDESIHVPMLIRYPQKIKKGTFKGNVSSIDLFPTILGLIELPSCPVWEGVDALSLGENGCNSRPIFAASIAWHNHWMAIQNDLKVFLDFNNNLKSSYKKHDLLNANDLGFEDVHADNLMKTMQSVLGSHIYYYERPSLHTSYVYPIFKPTE